MENIVKKRRYGRGLFLLSVLLIGILANIWNTAPIKAEKKSGTPFAIEETGYENWTAADLPTAQQETKDFLEAQKVTGATAERPYKGNTVWTEGSLMAVDKAYQSSLTVENGVSTDLARMLLIETVKKLEKATTFAETDPRITSVNNYPNENGEYDLEYNMPAVPPDERSLKYDVMFVLDWSHSMQKPLGYAPDALKLGADHVKALAQHVIENYQGSRVWLLGYNSPRNNTGGSTNFTAQVNTGFFGKETDYMKEISDAYKAAPDQGEDDVPIFIQDATDKMKLKRDPEAIPVMVVLSDFQLMYDSNSATAGYIRYKTATTNFWSIFNFGNKDPMKTPIYIAVRYDHTQNMATPGLSPDQWQTDAIKDPLSGFGSPRPRWAFEKVTPTTLTGASDRLIKRLDDSLPNRPSTEYNMNGIGTDFDYILNSVVSTDGFTKVTQPAAGSINFNNNENDTGSLKVNYRDSAVLNKKMGDLLPAYTESKLTFINSEYQDANKIVQGLPNLFSPVSEAAIELYHYKGTGDKADPANYEPKQTIVGDKFNIHGGTALYPLTNTKLSSIEYGKTLSKADVLDITKAALGQAEWDQLLINDNLTEASKKITFDAAKNVYKLYAEPSETKLTVKFVDEKGVDIILPIEQIKTVGEPVDLTTDQKVLDAIQEVLGKHYDLSERPIPEKFNMSIDGNTVVYKFTGQLIFVSAPPKIDFGIKSGATLAELDVDKPEYTVPLVVLDNRAGNRDWKLTVKLEEPFANVSDKTSVLPEALVYKRGTAEDVLELDSLGKGKSVLITQQSSTKGVEYNVSDKEWEKDGNGFKFKLPKGRTKKLEEYKATLVYTLGETP